MKRTILFFTLVFCAAALVLAQGNNRWGKGSPEKATVSGNLSIAQGMIAVVSGDTTWLVRGINRYIGFIDGLKEGAEVTLEGYAMPASRDKNVKSLQVQKMTLNGKDYELARPRPDVKPEQMQRQRPHQQGPMHQPRQRGRR